MNEAPWLEMNQRALATALDRVRIILQRYVSPDEAVIDQANAFVSSALDRSSALHVLCETFSLSPFERDVLLWCAGLELDARFASLFAATPSAQPTFSLALAALPDAHWSALAPHAPLRYWRLIEVGNGPTLTRSPLRIDERILHYLTGLQPLDDRLTGLVEPLTASDDVTPTQRSLVDRIAAAWSRAASPAELPLIQLCGDEPGSLRAIATAACAALGLHAFEMSASAMPAAPVEVEALIRLWEREAALSASALVIQGGDVDAAEANRVRQIDRFVEHTRSPLIIISRERRVTTLRALITLDVRRPTTDEQRAIWRAALGPAAPRLNGQLDRLMSQFRLSAAGIHSASRAALSHATDGDDLGAALWEACRVQARPQLDDLAQRLDPIATWDDLVLPVRQKQTLREIAAHVRQRAIVYETWGFTTRSLNGLGITALFAGDSGTGKTMAAEVLANELRLDLYRIDLSQVVSKYIGETEKNLRRVFDAAEAGGAILLFDEADALFGKRSEVKDSHDRYANIEVSYLLQRMEAYRGLAILTTNLKSALDTAFLRRLRFIVQFPFPDAAQRAEIWQRIFPPNTPTEGLELAKLARLNVAGGGIRNVALNAAFLAADTGEPVRMRHLLQAARSEYAKLEKPLTDAEVKDWIVMSDESHRDASQ